MADDLLAPADNNSDDVFALRGEEELRSALEETVHLVGAYVCDTERRAEVRTGLELIVHAGEGFIPLWDRNVILRWRFQERSLARFRNPERVKNAVRTLLHAAIGAWGDAAPIRFSEQTVGGWDFEIAVRDGDHCSPAGCTLASAFFPDQGQHELVVYPMMFTLDAHEQLETLAHEIGHIFGLRHFFALELERGLSAEAWGQHEKISIMNYGDDSQLTPTDREDLKRLYDLAWSGQLTDINRTPIRLMRPFSSLRP
ncbi:MAG TPA: matrixin family metalloprotease [Allosphingosinicella sp.]